MDLTETDLTAIQSDLLHLILTKKRQRLYNPRFGTDLLRFIFEPDDSITLGDIKQEISDSVRKYIPNLRVNDIFVQPSNRTEYAAVINIDYTITDDVFDVTETLIVYV